MRIVNLTRPLSRRALPRPNLAYYLWRFVANGARTCRAMTMRPCGRDTPALAHELRQNGIAVSAGDHLLTESSRAALDEAARRILHACDEHAASPSPAGASAGNGRKRFLVDLVEYPEGIPEDDPLLKVALDRNLLEVVSSYLGLWPCLYSVRAWLNVPTDEPPQVSQLWHRDPEDLQLIKVFIYLEDVGEDGGPFTYIPRTHPFGAETTRAQKLEKKKRLPDERVNKMFPSGGWRVCTGPAGTLILADTVGYHRGGKPLAGRRVLITFTYTSGTPITDCPVRVKGVPAWLASGLQQSALKLLLQRRGPVVADTSGKKDKKKTRRTY